MSHDHHNHNGHSEKKSVAFGTPLILGVVTVFIILCFVSLGNPCHGKCCDEGECKKECAEGHGGHGAKHEEKHDGGMNEAKHGAEQESVSTPGSVEHANQNDSTKTEAHAEPAKEEAHH